MADVRMLIAALLLCLAGGSGLIYLVAQPTHLRVGIAADDTASRQVLQAAETVFRDRRKAIRLKTVMLGTAAEVASALNAGSIDLGVVRSDYTVSTGAEAAMVLRREALVIVAKDLDDTTDIGALAGKRIGLVAFGGVEPGNRLNALFEYYGLAGASQKITALKPADLTEALASKRFDAYALIGVITTPAFAASVRRVAETFPTGVAIINLAEAEALAQRVGDIETVPVPVGIFRGHPPLPVSKKDTLALPIRLVASPDLDSGKVSQLLQQFLAIKSSIRRLAPGLENYEVPDPEISPYLVHQGARAFRDGESTSFLDRYGDVLYLGLFVTGALASMATALAARLSLGRRRRLMGVLHELRQIGGYVSVIASLDEVATAEAKVDALMASVFERAANCELSADDLAAISLAFGWWRGQVDAARQRLAP